LESAAEWKIMPQKKKKMIWGIKYDLPTDKKEVQQRRLHKKSQPLEQLDRVIEEIKKLMLRSAEAVSRGELNRREPAIAAGKKQKKKKKQKQQQHSWRGARGQLQGEFGIQEDFNTGEEELMRRSSCFS
jgi:hypothetical protein